MLKCVNFVLILIRTGWYLDSQLSWESGEFQLARWSQRVALWSNLDHPHLPTAKLSLTMLWSIPTLIVTLIKKVCAVSPPSSISFFCDFATLGSSFVFEAKFRIWQVSTCKMKPQSFFVCYLDPVESSIYLNLYLRVWHSQLSLFVNIG